MSETDINRIIRAASLSGEKLTKSIPGTPPSVFRNSHGPITINVTNDPIGDDGNCGTEGGSITCDQSPDMQNILHEFGHVFDIHNKGVNFPSGHVPIEWEGNPVGYICNRIPCMQHSKQQFPYLEHKLIEEFADMYMNWILDGIKGYPQNGFSDTDLGNDRRDWMNVNMSTFPR